MRLVINGGDGVDTGRHLPREHRQQRRDSRVSADVGYDSRAQAHQAAIAHCAELDVLDLSTSVRHPDQVLGAGLDPLHRLAELAGGSGHDDQLWASSGLGAETASHVADDHANVRWRHTERGRHLGAQPERGLAGRPNQKSPCFRHDQDRLRFHRHRREPLVDEAAPDFHFGAGEDVILATGVESIGDVGTMRWEKQRGIRPAGGFRVDDDSERFEVETDQLRGILGRTRALRHDESHRLADKANALSCEGRPRQCFRHHLKADASR